MIGTGVRPTATITEGIMISIESPRTEEEHRGRVYVPDDGTIGAFLDWQSQRSCFPVWTVIVAPGQYRAFFTTQNGYRARTWLRRRGVSFGG